MRVTVTAVKRLISTPMRQADGEAHDEGCAEVVAEPVQDDAGDERRSVGVANRGPGALEAQINGGGHRSARAQLFLDTLKYQHIGVYRHTNSQTRWRRWPAARG